MVQGKVINQQNLPVSNAIVQINNLKLQNITDSSGNFIFNHVPIGNYQFEVFATGYTKENFKITINKNQKNIIIKLKTLDKILKDATVIATEQQNNGISRLNSVDGFGIYEAKKTELIVLKNLNVNMATNNARQVFGKVPGLNIWESDQAGLQLGVGGRGLSPNRTSNFNTRQNGYDMSADALGYPETYYTPPIEAIEKIEVVRGAASLQYGTQFGGMLNFVFKKGPTDKEIEVVSRQTIGSFGFLGTFNSLGGTIAKGKLNFYTFFNHKQGYGWRPNSQFNVNTAYIALNYKFNDKFDVIADYTYMYYNAQQPGGLTDAQFNINPRQSLRQRNWFRVNWNLASISSNYRFNNKTSLNTRFFGLLSNRYSLGNLDRINVVDFGGNRTLITGDFNNVGNETRLLHQYTFLGKPHTLLIGLRLYRGKTISKQGDGNNKQTADYFFLNPNNLEGSNYSFLNINRSFFAENIFRLSEKLSITPGLRYEYINTSSKGYYKILSKDAAGNIIADTNVNTKEGRVRVFILAGLGISFKLYRNIEFYGNISQNYRAVNFNDLRIINPNVAINPNIRDESGYTADIGLRGYYKKVLNYDFSLFLLRYNDRIGNILKADRPPLFQDYRFRTNIADARNIGAECYAEADIWQIFKPGKSDNSLYVFTNLAYVNAQYINTSDKSVQGKKVEMAPEWMLRGGITFKRKTLSATFQNNYVSQHFTDATNAKIVAGAVNGIIPTYTVSDISINYGYKNFVFEASCNNVLNQMYFTRRADAYPGPGIIPSDGRGFYFTIGLKL